MKRFCPWQMDWQVFGLAALICVAWLLLADGVSASDQIRLSTGVYYAQGEYTDVALTKITMIPASVRVQSGNWTYKWGLPLVQIEGPGNVSEMQRVGNVSRGGDYKSQGLGDITFESAYTFQVRRWFFDAALKLKLPTADQHDGLGTGTFDQDVRCDWAYSWQRWAGFGSVGYRFRGDNDQYELRDTSMASAGVQMTLSPRYTFGTYYNWRDAVRRYSAPLQEGAFFLSVRSDKHWKTTLTLSQGFSTSSADWSTGLQVAYQY